MDDGDAGGRDPASWAPRVVVVGGGVAGYAVVRQLHSRLPRARIHLYDGNRFHHYSACGMTFALEGLYPLADVVLRTPEEYDGMGIEVHEGVEAGSIDLDERSVVLSDGGRVRFDVLVLATGRLAFRPPVPGVDLEGVHTLSNYGDGQRVIEAAAAARSAIVVGGGAIGLEAAVALRARGMEVTVIEMLPHLLPQMLDPGPAQVVRDHLESRGIQVLTGMGVSAFVDGGNGRAVAADVLGEEMAADLFIVSTGVRPRASLAEVSGLDTGPTGGFATDEHLRVLRQGRPVDGVYAVGDCAEVRHAVTRRATLSPLASTAVYEARTVAEHLLDPARTHHPVVAPAVVVIDGLHVGSVGLTEHGASGLGMEAWGVYGSGLDRSRYFPGAQDLHLGLVGDGEGRIIGAQAVGWRDVKERTNLMALAISVGIPPRRLVEVERAYSPPLQLLVDPVVGLLDEFILRADAMAGRGGD